MNTNELIKSEATDLLKTIDYLADAVVIKNILDKSSGNVVIMAFDKGNGQSKKINPFDTFVQIIDGEVEIIINEQFYFLKTGEAIIIPAHASNSIRANGRFKLIQTIIKSGYE